MVLRYYENSRGPVEVVLGILNPEESSLSEGAGENPVVDAKLGGAGLDGFSIKKITEIIFNTIKALWIIVDGKKTSHIFQKKQ